MEIQAGWYRGDPRVLLDQAAYLGVTLEIQRYDKIDPQFELDPFWENGA